MKKNASQVLRRREYIFCEDFCGNFVQTEQKFCEDFWFFLPPVCLVLGDMECLQN